MIDENRVIELEITVKERTTFGLTAKTFSDSRLEGKRAVAIVELIEYLADNFSEDYLKAEF